MDAAEIIASTTPQDCSMMPRWARQGGGGGACMSDIPRTVDGEIARTVLCVVFLYSFFVSWVANTHLNSLFL